MVVGEEVHAEEFLKGARGNRMERSLKIVTGIKDE